MSLSNAGGKPADAAPSHNGNEAGPRGPASRFFNRELSLLKFNWRVLHLARARTEPLLERLRFLTIGTSNLDEFFEVRVAGLKSMMQLGVKERGVDGLSPSEAFERVSAEAHELVAEQYRVLNNEILPALEEEGVRVLKRDLWSDPLRRWVENYFEEQLLPVLSPVGLDPAHPFPRIPNKSLNFIVPLRGLNAFGQESHAAVVQAPRVLPRLIEIPEALRDRPHEFVLLSSVLHEHVGRLFTGMEVLGCFQFRITRNADIWVDEEEVEDLLRAYAVELFERRFAEPVRLEVADNCTPELQQFLLDQCGLGEKDLYKVNGPVNLIRLQTLCDLVDRPDLKHRPFTPGLPKALQDEDDIFATIRRGDVLLHHPYESFTPVLELIDRSARDPNVLAIKQMVYRTGAESPLVNALLTAARAGKEVTAVVELRARFDEAENIDLAKKLQEAGAKVIYGVVGHKTHAKMLLVVRREGDRLRRYVHLSTGNYHAATSRAYTDFGLMTCDEEIARDVHELFLQLTGLGRATELRKLHQSPFTLHQRILEWIDFETAEARAGRPARIIAKMNSLIEPQVIEALYRASQDGVEIDLIVRGVCCLRPGVHGLSERIRVRSILGRFLEHSRIFHFHAAGRERTFCSSADWMPRNFFNRVEACFPIDSPELKRRVIEEGLECSLRDNAQAWELDSAGDYHPVTTRGGESFSSHEKLLEKLASREPTPLQRVRSPRDIWGPDASMGRIERAIRQT